MKIAVMSDIHGNYIALQRCLAHANAFDFQQLVTNIVEDAAELPEQSTEKKNKD